MIESRFKKVLFASLGTALGIFIISITLCIAFLDAAKIDRIFNDYFFLIIVLLIVICFPVMNKYLK